MMSTWISLMVGLTIFVGAAAFLMGRLAAKTSRLEQMLEVRYAEITSSIARLDETFDGIRVNVSQLRQEIEGVIEKIRSLTSKD